jgi:hypothetical protein
MLTGRPLAVLLLACGLLSVGAGVTGLAWRTGHHGVSLRPVPPAAATPSGPAAGQPGLAASRAMQAAAAPGPGTTRAVPRPVSLTIPAIRVNARLIRLDLTPQGTLQVPASPAVPGWYAGSPRPGEIGSAIIVGHIDSYRGPGVFFGLLLLRPGDLVYVRGADGTRQVFRVYAKHMYSKTEFPTNKVYGPTPDPELRLITCGGVFDLAAHSYLSNVVVYAAMVH